VRILRDLAHSSRVLILLELRHKPAKTLKPIAEALSLTQQAVSGYVGQLEDDGLVARTDGLLRLTPKGEALLQAEVDALKAFVDRQARELVRLETCVAIASAPVHKGTKVYLHMARGRLTAALTRTSPSWGVALEAAAKGREVLVGDLHGIVEIERASLTLIEVPSPREGGSKAIDPLWLDKVAHDDEHGVVAALDEAGEGALAGSRRPWHFEFAPAASAAAAVARGAHPTYLGGPETVALLVAALEASKAEGRLPGFSYTVVKAPRRKPAGRAGR
jgi:predicted transcriptional regulator